ncbi:MAG: DNA polymerase III subunit beta [Anaerolineaceae bacterium]|nr:DNA polymerase III subunit beta [Anaerolineaceae bacterium]
MKAVCDRAILSEAFQMAHSVVSVRSPKPALQCVKIESTKKELRLLATDLEVGVRISLTEGMQISEGGEALLPADRVAAILKELSSEKISLMVEDTSVLLETDDSRFSIRGDSPSAFPAVADFGEDGATQLESAKLARMIHRTIFATAREAARYALNGVLWEIDGKEFRLVATDGHRLALAKGECKGDKSAGQVSAIVPTKAMHLIERSIQNTETVDVQIGEKQLLVKAGNVVIYSRLVDGHFPKYDDVIPKDSDKKAKVSTGALLSAVRRASLLTNEESRGVKLTFSKKQIVLSSRAPEMGEAKVTMKAEFEGADDGFKIAFNPFFMIDVLKVIDTDELTLQMKSANKPGLIRLGSQYVHVLMPVNIL